MAKRTCLLALSTSAPGCRCGASSCGGDARLRSAGRMLAAFPGVGTGGSVNVAPLSTARLAMSAADSGVRGPRMRFRTASSFATRTGAAADAAGGLAASGAAAARARWSRVLAGPWVVGGALEVPRRLRHVTWRSYALLRPLPLATGAIELRTPSTAVTVPACHGVRQLRGRLSARRAAPPLTSCQNQTASPTL